MKRNKFSLSHYKLTTFDMGQLIPLTWYEAIPGDTIQQSTSALVRVNPLLSPVMHPVRVRIHHWFVPNRLIWTNWEDFITGGPDGQDATEHPYCRYANIDGHNNLPQYLGTPAFNYGSYFNVNALPLRAYNLIYNTFYRDQDLINEEPLSLADGLDTTTNNDVLNVSWEKDYFTTARPTEQKGAAVTIPIGDTAPVQADGTGNPSFDINGSSPFYLASGPSGLETETRWNASPSTSQQAGWDDPRLEADLSLATGVDINDLRFGMAIQRYQEARQQYGSRYVEYLRYCGVKSSDARLANPEYLGGGRQVIQFSEVLQNAPDTAEGTVVGDMKGHGIAAMRTNKYRRFIEEHGIIMTLMSVIPKAIYTAAVDRGQLRQVKEDYYQKELAYLGEQPITNREVQANHSSPDGIFGYQQRYDEYRQIHSKIDGNFRFTEKHWHYGRIHSGDIALNSSFINAVPTKRVNADTEGPCLKVMANHSIQARRPIPANPKPKLF